MIQLLLSMKLTVVDCNYRCFFVTSDNPVVRSYPSAPNRLDDEVWFPISYRRGVLWHRHNREDRTTLGYSQSLEKNKRVIRNSYKFVYSPLQDDWVESAAKNESRNQLLGHYESLEKVVERGTSTFGANGVAPENIVDTIAAMKSGERLDVVGIK